MAFTNSPIYKLPGELIRDIADCLDDPKDAARLALTCKWTLGSLGKKSLQLDVLDRELLLARFAEELPGQNYCVYCRTIHRTVAGYETSWHKDFWQQCRPDRNAAWDLWANGRLNWAYGGRFLGSWHGLQYISIAPGYLLHHKHVQYVMTHHRHGRDVSSDLSQFTHAAELPTAGGQKISYEVSAQISTGTPSPRVPAGAPQPEFLLRTVYRARPGADRGCHLCPHLCWRPGYLTPHRGAAGATFAPGAGLQQCDRCHTECAVERLADGRLQATAWSNFGARVGAADFRRHAAPAEPGVGAYARGSVVGAWREEDGAVAGLVMDDVDELQGRGRRDSVDSLQDILDDVLP